MPAIEDQVINPGFLKGVDFTNDARVSNPGSYKKLYNLIARSPGVLSVRPGSAVISTECLAPGRNADPTFTPGAGASSVNFGFTFIAAKGRASQLQAMISAIPAVSTHRGISSLWARAIPSPVPIETSFPTHNANSTNAGGEYINGITRAYVPALNRSYWFGAVHRAGEMTDYLFWLDESSIDGNGNARMRAIPLLIGHISGSSDDWTFLPVASGRAVAAEDKQFLTSGLIAFATNGVGRVIGIYYNADFPNDPFEARALEIRTNGNVAELGDLSDFCVVNVQSLCMYKGQVVIGGFGLYDESADEYHDFSNCVTWIDRNAADGGMLVNNNAGGVMAFRLTDDSTHFYFVRAGEDLSERVRGVSPIASLIDTQAISGSLAIFTDKAVKIYVNPPPTGGNPNGQDFHVTALGEFGSCAPKSIARTPKGVVFLATDGIFYLITLENQILPISRAIASEFQGISPRFFRKVAAYYDGEFYVVFFPTRPRTRSYRYTSGSQTPLPGHNTYHFYADLRYVRPAPDMGVLWYGRHDGVNASCCHVARDMEDFGVVMAGMGHTMALVQLNRPDLRTDPDMSNIDTGTRRFPWIAISGDFDNDEVHIDKTITALRVALRTRADINLTMGMTVFGPSGTSGAAWKKVIAVPATGTDGDPGPNANGTEPYQSQQSMALPVLLPPEGLRGRLFEFQIAELTPTNNAFPAFSDIELTLKDHPRRSTGVPT